MRRFVWSSKLVNEVALAHWELLRQNKFAHSDGGQYHLAAGLFAAAEG